MTVHVDPDSGFCPGVVSAIRKAEVQLAEDGRLYCLGDIVHNSQEVHRLEAKGLETINHAQMEALTGVSVLLRAHGEPPSTYTLARRNRIQVVDATCPVVLLLQKKIRRQYEAEHDRGVQIVIFGKQGHAEVLGLVGQTEGHAVVIESPADLEKLDFARPVRLFSQTTMPVDAFRRLCGQISERMQRPDDFQSFDTICRQVADRIPRLRTFAARHDVVLFVSGKKSSNGHALFDECRAVNPRSHFVSDPADVQASMLAGATSVGVCGATSTPRWQMEQVAEYVSHLNQ